MHREAQCVSDSAKAESCHVPWLSSVGREETPDYTLCLAPLEVSSNAEYH